MDKLKNLRVEKGTQSPAMKGEGSTYIIPADDAPSGLEQGVTYDIIIRGVCNNDEQGLIILVDRILAQRVSRTDPIQDNITSELKNQFKK